MPINPDDVTDFLRYGLALICALAYCGWTFDLIRLASKARVEDGN